MFTAKKTLLDAFRTNSRNIIGRNLLMVIPLLANQDLMPVLIQLRLDLFLCQSQLKVGVNLGSVFQFFKECFTIKKSML